MSGAPASQAASQAALAAEPSVAAMLKRPFAEQVAFFRAKLGHLVPTQRWDDMVAEAHDTGFMVAGAAKADLLTDLAVAVDRAITEGQSLETFRRDFRAVVARNGWHGWTGEGSVQGEAWRTRVIYRTNAATSYAAGRHAQLVEGKFSVWVYRHGDSRHPRPQHLAWNGLSLPPDHPFWRAHFAPNGWGCSCYVLGARSAAGARRLGGDPDKQPPPGWDMIDRKTGAPVGIDRGWDYAPGASVAQTVATVAAKVRHWDYQIAKAYMLDVPAAQRDALAHAYRALPSVADDVRRYAERALGARNDAPIPGPVEIPPTRTLGLITGDDAHQVAALKGVSVNGYDFSVDRFAPQHIREEHGDAAVEARRGQRAVTADDYAHLPVLLDRPDRIEDGGVSDTGRPVVRYVKTIAGEIYTAALELRSGRRTLALQSLWIRRAS